MTPSVMICGLAFLPELLPPDVDAAKLESDMHDSQALLEKKGYSVHNACTIIPEDDDLYGSAVKPYEQALIATKPDLVVIGFGVRGIPKYTHLFELLVNKTIEVLGKDAKFAFNSSPDSTVAAVERILPL